MHIKNSNYFNFRDEFQESPINLYLHDLCVGLTACDKLDNRLTKIGTKRHLHQLTFGSLHHQSHLGLLTCRPFHYLDLPTCRPFHCLVKHIILILYQL